MPCCSSGFSPNRARYRYRRSLCCWSAARWSSRVISTGAPVLFSGLVACLIADCAWFQIGRSRGSKVLAFLCRLALEPDSCVRQTEGGFARYGVRFLLVSKFIPGMNALAAPLAGSAGVRWIPFLIYDSARRGRLDFVVGDGRVPVQPAVG